MRGAAGAVVVSGSGELVPIRCRGSGGCRRPGGLRDCWVARHPARGNRFRAWTSGEGSWRLGGATTAFTLGEPGAVLPVGRCIRFARLQQGDGLALATAACPALMSGSRMGPPTQSVPAELDVPTYADRMIILVPVTQDESVDARFGKAARVAVAQVSAGGVVESWEEHDVRWDISHDVGAHGAHHANIVRFLREHQVTGVVAEHVGPPMLRTLGSMGVAVVLGASGPARTAVEQAVRQFAGA